MYGVYSRSSIFVAVLSSPVLRFGEGIQILWLPPQRAVGGCLSCLVSICLVRRISLDDCGCGRGGGTIAHLANRIVYLLSCRGGGARYDCTTSLPHRAPDVSNNFDSHY